MLNLTEYRQRPACLADYLPWAALVASGVVLNKDGSFQRTALFRGPDLESSTDSELVACTARLNNALRRLGSGWALFVEAERAAVAAYPYGAFPDPLSWLVDEERRASFEAADAYFESRYYATLVYLPPAGRRAKVGQWMLEGSDQATSVDWDEQLQRFITETDRFLGLLDGVMPEVAWAGDEETLTYLHGTVSCNGHRIAVPEVPFHLDALLTDSPLAGGLSPRLGDEHLRVLTVRGFPASSWPGMLDELNAQGFAYRWVTRFVFLDKAHAERELVRLRRQWFAKRKSITALLRETIFQQESPLVDSDADNKAGDADAALQELGSDEVAFGYVTATLVVRDADAGMADEKIKAIERIVQGRGFVTIRETFNAVEAWLSSIPGNVYANVRQPLISTLNLAHLMPMSALWAGQVNNAHLNGPPLLIARTGGVTPFRWVTHIGDVGHTLIVGPTGAGKSVLLSVMAMQFRRYERSRVVFFDKGGSARATVLGLQGQHVDLGEEGAIAFQPLARIDEMAERSWAAQWIAGLLSHERVELTPEVKDAVWSALNSLASAPIEQRTLTGLSVLLQSNALRQALQPYTLNGPMGRLLDADHDQVSLADVQGFEMESLMQGKSAVLPVLLYLFHRLEVSRVNQDGHRASIKMTRDHAAFGSCCS
jgi:type IV secretion system protein VirB4